jgi:hypothetical protein
MSRIEEALKKATRLREKAGNEQFVRLHKRRKSVSVTAAIIFLVTIIIGTLSYLSKTQDTKGKSPPELTAFATSVDDDSWAANTVSVMGNTYNIEMTYLKGNLLNETLSASKLTFKDLSENEFYSINLKAVNECIPDDIVASARHYVSIIKGGEIIKPKELTVLDDIKKVIYKPSVCKKKGIIFARFYIAYSKELKPEGLLIDGRKILFKN